MIELVRCPREACKRIQFEVETDAFKGGVIIRCHRCKRYLNVTSATSIEVLTDYESPNVVTFNIQRPAANSAQRNAR